MTRRDTIIIAVTINALLLIVLFMSALKTDSHEVLATVETTKQPERVYTPPVKTKSKKKAQVQPVASEKVAKKEKQKVTLPKKKNTEALVAKVPEVKKPTLRTVTVQKGDVLEKIAKRHHVTVGQIMQLNNLSSSRLDIGQVLKLPEARKMELAEPITEGKYYTVKGGDNPWTIARKNNMKVEDLLELNQMDEEKAKRIRPGDRLKIK